MNDEAPKTRLLALGSAPLVQGFALIGFEAYPDASAAELERLLAELHQSHATALVLVEYDLARQGGEWYRRLRDEGGRIVIGEIPPLNAPGDYHPPVEDLLAGILGPHILESSG